MAKYFNQHSSTRSKAENTARRVGDELGYQALNWLANFFGAGEALDRYMAQDDWSTIDPVALANDIENVISKNRSKASQALSKISEKINILSQRVGTSNVVSKALDKTLADLEKAKKQGEAAINVGMAEESIANNNANTLAYTPVNQRLVGKSYGQRLYDDAANAAQVANNAYSQAEELMSKY